MALNLPPGWNIGRVREFLNKYEGLCNLTIAASGAWSMSNIFANTTVFDIVKNVQHLDCGEDFLIEIEHEYSQLEYQFVVSGGGDAGLIRTHKFNETLHEDSCFHGLVLKLVRLFWTDFWWMIDIQNGGESDVGLSAFSEAEGLSGYFEIGDTIRSFQLYLRREKAFLLDKVSVDLDGILVSENGPSLPGEFVWNGSTIKRLEPTPWRLLDFIWKQPGRHARYSEEMAQFVWMDRNKDYEGSPIKEAARDIRDFFRKNKIPLTCSNSASSRSVAVISTVSQKNTE